VDGKLVSARLYTAEHQEFQRPALAAARLAFEASPRERRASAVGLLLVSFGVWAAVWAGLASLSSWLR